MHSTNGLQVFLYMMYCSCSFRGICGEEGNFRGQDIKNLCKRCKKIDFAVFTDFILPSSHGTMLYHEKKDQLYVQVESTYEEFNFIFGGKKTIKQMESLKQEGGCC